MKMISVMVVYYNHNESQYGPVMHTAGYRTFFPDEAARYVRNHDSISRRAGAHSIVWDRDTGLALQVSGYSEERGMFCDVVPMEEMETYLKVI